MQYSGIFARDYKNARVNFLEACRDLGLAVQTLTHPLLAHDGTMLATDIVRVGPLNASHLLVLTSGVHGPELMAGSACQVDWLQSHMQHHLPPHTAVLIVHAINPWGAAYRRRNNEGNVDLCRNWVDFDQQLPINAAYAELKNAVNSSPDDTEAADAQLEHFGGTHGVSALYGALMAGQYSYADGLGFGGHEASWSRSRMEEILCNHAVGVRHICLVDYHTGVGPYGYGSIVALQSGDSLVRAKQAFGGWLIAPNASNRPADFIPVTGHTTQGYERALSNAQTTSVVLEFGTYSQSEMLEVLIADHRLTHVGGGDTASLDAARSRVQRFFLPDDSDWQDAVLHRSQQVTRQALTFLGGQA